MKELETITVSKVGQSTLPQWWREQSGLEEGGLVEVRPINDGNNSIVLTPVKRKRVGAVGLVEHFATCPYPIPVPERHVLPFK